MSVPATLSDACVVATSSTPPTDSASVVITSTVDPRNASHPTTWGERFLFALAADTVLHVDCRGQPLTERAGPYSVRDVGRATFLLEPVAGARGPRLTIRVATAASARDLIAAGADLLLTETPTLAAYAATRPEVISLRLGWNRTWVALTALPGGLGLDSSSSLRASMVRDVVPADARVAEGPGWWVDSTRCGAPVTRPEAAAPSPVSSRVVYPREEPIARALAERLVALVGAGTVATGLTPNAFESALQTGTELAYVFPLERRPIDSCQSVARLMAAAPWLARLPDGPRAITPLVDTRLLAVVKRDRLNLTLAADSTIVILPPHP
jgi:hypothetical protein